MATASVTYSFSGGGNAVASQVNQDFSDVVTFLNNSVLHVDGSKQLTGQLSLTAGTDPTSADHAARKAYVDKYNARSARTNIGVVGPITTVLSTLGTVTITDPGYDITVWGTCHVLCTNTGTSIATIGSLVGRVDSTERSILRIPMVTSEQSIAVSIPSTTHTTGTNATLDVQLVRTTGAGSFTTQSDSRFSWIEAWYKKS